MRRHRVQKRRFSLTLIALLLLFAAAVVMTGGWLLIEKASSKLSTLALFGLGERFSTKVYAAPLLLKTQSAISPATLTQRLKRLGYTQAEPMPEQPGQYALLEGSLFVYLRGLATPKLQQESLIAEIIIEDNVIITLRDIHGMELGLIMLEPELIAELSGPENIRREPATSEQIPAHLKKAIVAAEDKRFYEHHGIDWRSIARALWFNLTQRRGLQGASTITQQLAKNLLLSPERTLSRKIKEALLALYLETNYSKDKILTLYANEIYFGQEGVLSIAGVRAASDFYFGKNLQDLNLAENALLAAIIRSPNRYNPLRHPEEAIERRDFILNTMLETGFITRTEWKEALNKKLLLKNRRAQLQANHAAGYFQAEVERYLIERFGKDIVYRYGLKVYTTMDPLLQKWAHQAVQPVPYQAALVALDARTGRILALVGGKRFTESQFNRATQARRQPGSAFKPFVYGAAIREGLTAATRLNDKKKTYLDRDKKWEPKNYKNQYLGEVSLRESLSRSLNAATLDLAQRLGTEPIVRYARRLGIASDLEPTLALALGSYETTLLELTAAYAPFANGGYAVKPYFIDLILDANGQSLEWSLADKRQVLDQTEAALMTSLLAEVVETGTAKYLKEWGWDRPTAGKTGTTNQEKDAWFIGYTPQLLAGVWAGEDQGQSIKLTGAQAALPVWALFMKNALQDEKPQAFNGQTKLLATATIDPQTGRLANAGCPQKRKEYFLPLYVPREHCPDHPSGLKGWLGRLFRQK